MYFNQTFVFDILKECSQDEIFYNLINIIKNKKLR